LKASKKAAKSAENLGKLKIGAKAAKSWRKGLAL
jgi:hypothetical protein